MSFYGDFTIEEAGDIGRKFKVTCHYNGGYEGQLTEGKEYEATMELGILALSPLFSFINDKGKESCAHIQRFTKAKESTDDTRSDATLST